MKPNLISLAIAVVAVLLTGCKKDSADAPSSTPTGTTTTATVRLDFQFKDATDPFILGQTVLQDSLGHTVKLDGIRFYVSGIQAVNTSGGSMGNSDDVYMLVDAAQPSNDFLLGQFAPDTLQKFYLNIGVDPVANLGDPTTAPAPLNDTSMYFGMQMMGYKFLEVKGHADIDGDGTFETAVLYECGMDNALVHTFSPQPVHVLLAEEDYPAPVPVDLSGLFAGLDLAVSPAPNMHMPEAMRIINNMGRCINGL
jgi:hypothetical protein